MEYQEHSIGSDRLRKAIERNKAKQVKRSSRSAIPVSPTRATRRTVARPDTVEFGPINRPSTTRAVAKVDYRRSVVATENKKIISSSGFFTKWQNLFTKIGWGFSGVLLVHLVFSNGGVIDYYSRVSQLEQRMREFDQIILQNKEILAEIKKIKTNNTYQKKLVRDNLGLIATDEYLVVFP